MNLLSMRIDTGFLSYVSLASTELNNANLNEKDLLSFGQTLRHPRREPPMLYTLISLILFVWLIGLLSHFGGDMIHTLLLVAGVLFLFQLFTGRRVD